MSQKPNLLPCPFCGGAMQPRDALWPSEGDTDAVIHAQPTDCPMTQFSDHTADRSIYEKWNQRIAAQAVAAHARGPEIYVTEGGTLVIAENGDEFEVGSDGSMSGGNLEDYKYARLLPEITKQLSPEQLRLFPLAAHAREPDEAMVEAAAKALCADDGRFWEDGHFGTIRDSYRWKARIALAAIGSVPQDRNAILDEVFAAISPTTVRNERIIRALKSPENPPAPTPPAAERASDDNSHSHIIDQARYWLSRIDTRDPDLHRLLLERNMVVTSLIGERAEPAASDLREADEASAREIWLCCHTGYADPIKVIAQCLSDVRDGARREAAADMRERQIEALRGKAKAEKAQGYDGGWAARAANWLACDDLPLRALPLTEEETTLIRLPHTGAKC